LAIAEQTAETAKAAKATRDSVGHIERQAGIMDGQLAEMKQAREIATKTLVLQFRPKITVRIRDVLRFPLSAEEAELTGETPYVRIEFGVFNTGGSAARIVQSEIYAEAIESAVLPRIGGTYPIGTYSLQPGAANVHFFKCDEGVTVAIRESDDIASGTLRATPKHIYFVGIIWYADDIGITRNMSFMRKYDPQARSFVPTRNPDTEYTD
jgi:hypothetical protein